MKKLGCGVLAKTQEYRIVCLSAGSNPASRAKRMGLGRTAIDDRCGFQILIKKTVANSGFLECTTIMHLPSPARSGNERRRNNILS